MRRLIFILVGFTCLFAGDLQSQTGYASLTGFVTDATKAVIPGVKVIVINDDTNARFEGVTNKAGNYDVRALPPGRYRIEVEKPGFKTVVKSDLTFHTQDTIALNFEMAVGSASEIVTVSDKSDMGTISDSPAVGLVVNRTFVENTPLNGRSFQDLIALAPGSVSSANGNGLYSINGQRDDSNYFVVDGAAANVNVSPSGVNGGDLRGLAGALPAQTALGTTQGLASLDSLQEFKIQTSGYSAEYGRQPGAQVELTTRSGTNNLHGSLFDYFRNDALDANDWFFNEQHLPKQAERQNDFGGTVGGTLVIPGVYNGKNKTFYFVSYEGLRLREPVFTGVQPVPSIALRKFASPLVQPFLNSTPLPTGPDDGDQCATSVGETFSCTAQWSTAYSEPSSLDALSIRVDQMIGERIQLFGRFSNTPSNSSIQNLSELRETINNSRTWTVGLTANISPHWLDELRINYTISRGQTHIAPDAFDGAVPYQRSLVVPPQYGSSGAIAATPFNFIPNADSFSIPTYQDQIGKQRQLNIIDGISTSKGAHAIKLGVDFRRLTPQLAVDQYDVGIGFGSITDYQQGTTSFGFVIGGHKATPVFDALSLYVQDHWAITQRLSADYGVRWEYDPAPGASDGVYPLALTSSDLTTADVARQGTPQYHTTYRNLAPRLGFAYAVRNSGHHNLIFRGGYGIFYDTGQSLGANGYSGYPFFAYNFFVTGNPIKLPIPAADLAPPALTFPVALTKPYGFLNGISDPELRVPYTEQWNLSLDQQLTAKNTLTISYVGNAGRHLLFTESIFGGSTVNPNFSTNGIDYTDSSATSSYNGLQIQDQGYLAPGMQVVASYAWAHALDDVSSDFVSNPPLRGNSDNDVRQVFNLALNYHVPGGGLNRVINALSHGWSVDNRFIAQSGYPLTVIQGFYLLPNGTMAPILPDLVPGVPIYQHDVTSALGEWGLNPHAFSAVPTDPNTGAPLQQGTVGRNYVHGPAFWSLNTGVERQFPLYEKLTLLFRVEAFNIFNHPNAGNISSNLASPTFGISNPGGFGGVPTVGVGNPLYGTGGARSLQLSLKLQF